MNRELIKDFKLGVLMATIIVPFPLLGLYCAPLYAWAIYFSWIGIFLFAQKPRRKKKREFQTFKIDETLIEELSGMEDAS